jgi:hypothetical protein
MTPVYAVQLFTAEKWKSIYISSFLPDAEFSLTATNDIVKGVLPVRLVKFVVKDFDFLGVYCKDFAVLQRKD